MRARLVAFGEVMARLSPSVGEILGLSTTLSTFFGGAEANAAATFAQLGGEATMLTTLPANALGRGVCAALAARGVATHAIRMTDGGRLGLYFATHGAGIQPPEVLYDRANSSFALDPAPQTPPVSSKARRICTSLASPPPFRAPQRKRRSRWRAKRPMPACRFPSTAITAQRCGRPGAATGPSILRELLSLASIAFVDHRDLSLLLDKQYPGAGAAEKKRPPPSRTRSRRFRAST